MATTTTNPDMGRPDPLGRIGVPAWPKTPGADSGVAAAYPGGESAQKPTQLDALQALLAFSALHEQVRRRRALAARSPGFDSTTAVAEFEPEEQFVLDEVLQLVAERGVAITGADGLAIALAENNEIVLRAAAGSVRPDVGARIERDSAFSGAAFRTAQVVNCDDTETDPRVNLQACRKLGARSMVAVPLCGRRRVIGLLEAFSTWPFAFNDSDVQNLTLLAELVLAALKPEDEDRYAESAQVAVKKLEPVETPAVATPTPTAPAMPSTPSVPRKLVTAENLFVDPSAALAPVPSTVLKVIPVTPSESPVSQLTAAAETLVKPELTFGQLEPERLPYPHGKLILLVGIVVAVAFVAGVWWKLKTSQLGSEIVSTQPKAVQQSGAEKSAAQPSVAPNGIPASLPGNPDTLSDTAEANNPPAAPQELSKFPHVTGIRHWSSADSSSIVLDLEDQVQYEAHRLTSPDRIYFDLHDTQLSPDLAGKSIEVGDALVNRIRVAQPTAGMTRIVLETKASTNFSVSLETNPYRLIVEVRKIGTTPKGAVNLFPNAPEPGKLAIVIPPPTKEDLQLRTRVPKMRIVVDAGHGGWDLGTVGKLGLLEKDLVLEIAQRLGKLLESRLGTEVIYTRQDDNYIPLDERADIANHSQADLFVSVHANYSDLPSARGVETYYTNFFSAPGSKDAGAPDADKRSVPGTLSNGVTPSLSPGELRERIDQSRRLAASVQRSLYGTLSVQNPGLRDRGIKQAGFVVLTESSMPGILAEVSFVSSPTDEQKLRSDGYREQIAEALYKGIARYAANSRGVKVASAKK